MTVLIDLPVEEKIPETWGVWLFQQIARHLPLCPDLLNFSLTSRKIHTAVFVTQAVFRELFLRIYDKPTEWQNYDYRRAYWRRYPLQRFLDTEDAETPGNISPVTLNISNSVKDLILESKTKNFSHLRLFASKSINRFTAFSLYDVEEAKALMVLQLILTNLAAPKFIAWADTQINTADSQRCAYGDGESALFEDDCMEDRDLKRLWCTSNFFLLHFGGFMEEPSGLQLSGLTMGFGMIVAEDRGAPMPWDELVVKEEDLSRYWFGFYAYLETADIEALRKINYSTPLLDHDDGQLSIMELDIRDSIITGSGSDIHPFTVNGTISPLPSVFSIPGWRKISFSNDYPQESWAYEGCLLPGGKTIIGRWTVPEGEADGTEGPFIMWSVSKEDYEYEKALREDVVCEDDFLNH